MDKILKPITDLMKYCGELIRNADRSIDMVSAKEGHANFVTTYDKGIQEALRDGLLKILPEAKFVGEEDDDHTPLKEGYTFVVDPIDGTTNFIKDFHLSAISVGLLKDGKLYMGVVYNPYINELFTAKRGEGAFLNGKPIHVSERKLKDGIVIFGTAPYYQELNQRSFDMAYDYFKRSLDIRRSGAATIDFCNIAAGRAELFFELKLSPWDYAAGALIVEEAGGVVTTADGDPITLDKPCSVMASNSVVRSEI